MMTTEITLHSDGLRFTEEQRRILLDTFASGASEVEFAALIEVAQKRNLDPFKREIFFVQRWDSNKNRMVWATQVAIDGLRLVAERSGLYAGQDEPEFEERDGVPVLCRVRVWRRDWTRPAVGVARWSEYVQTTRDKQSGQTRPNAMWAKMPYTMLAKCAEALAIRKAFPESAAGLYTDDEMGQALNDAPAPTPAQRADVRPIERTPAQLTDGRNLAPLGVEAPAAVLPLAPLGAVTDARTPVTSATAPLAYATPGLTDAEVAAMLAMIVACETLDALDATRAEIRPDVSTRATAAQRAHLRAAAEARRAALTPTEPEPPTPPRGGRKSTRSSTTATDGAPVESSPAAEAPAALAAVPAWMSTADTMRAHLAALGHSRAIEASARKHGRHSRAYRELAAARLEALTPADADGARITSASCVATVERWAHEGVPAKRAA